MQPLGFILNKEPVFLLAAVRIFAMIMTSPLTSMRNVSRIAKIGLAGLTAFTVSPYAYPALTIPDAFSLEYALLLLGEGLIGVLTGFFISILFATFSTAGQFFSFQMGFGASEVYDALAQIENPLMGQYFNFVAALVFLQIKGFQKLFLGGVMKSIEYVNCLAFLQRQEPLSNYFLNAVGNLFLNAMIISLPIMGTLVLIHVTMGLLTKAAPQMNLLSEGFPITILTAFLILTIALPFFINTFEIILENGLSAFWNLLSGLGGAR
ncbi:flagellar biosynthetic protein FliR [Treponema pedis]|uniref:Flagellar biosynthetic protein FliR n=2 Tax=Treponema pedis TaxID=409322 RepID=S6A3J5_9SPIR|nr:flagellar biosynthetic protein FliR [Treponema pedis]AGT43616.1 flagellar biosynthetic protein FliR [Treponema pedis str. T A4]QOW61144.1 flagellar biosynthetic protein FliR [Treponema pedis]